MTPKGKLLIIGGAEDKVDETLETKDQKDEFARYEILNELLCNKDKRIEIVTTGTALHDEVKSIYKKTFKEIGYLNVGFIPIKERVEASQKKFLNRIDDAGTIFFTGGDQFRLSTILGGTPFIELVRDRFFEDADFIVAGTSAGAMVMSSVMITGGGLSEALINHNLYTSSGFGFLPNCIIDTHFIKRGRFSRLAHAVIMNPAQLGIGLGEDTALVIKNGKDTECRGSGMVVIIDGKEILQTNITHVADGAPIFVENLKVHLLVKGCCFSLETSQLSHISIPPTISI